MFSAGVIEAIYVVEDCQFSGASGGPRLPPDQLRLNRLEERLNCGVVKTIPFPRHRYFEPMPTQDLLVVM